MVSFSPATRANGTHVIIGSGISLGPTEARNQKPLSIATWAFTLASRPSKALGRGTSVSPLFSSDLTKNWQNVEQLHMEPTSNIQPQLEKGIELCFYSLKKRYKYLLVFCFNSAKANTRLQQQLTRTSEASRHNGGHDHTNIELD